MMNRQAIKALLRPAYWRGRHLANRIRHRLRPPRKKIVFAFAGRSQYWPGMGRELYAAEPAFRDSVRESVAIVRELSGIDLLPNFEGPPDPDFFANERFIVLAIPVVQVALADLWASKGIRPNAVMGVSLGEIVACYAAGGVTRRGLFTVLYHFADQYERMTPDAAVLYLHTPLAQAFELAQRAPAWFEPIYELMPNGSLAFCREADRTAVTRYLQEQGIVVRRPHEDLARPYHTSEMKGFGAVLVPLYRTVEMQPMNTPFYSAVYGMSLPIGSLIDPAYWHELNTLPVREHSALAAAMNEGDTVFIQMGPHSFLRKELGEARNGPVLIDSMRRDRKESEQFDHALKTVRRLRREEPAVAPQDWLSGFRFSSPHVARDPYTYLRVMQAAGPVHYLAAEGAWLVLESETIEEVLKKPQVFSSRLHAPFDALLLGADPPGHTVMRNLLQPLFSPAALSALGTVTQEEGRLLLNGLPDNEPFDLVSSYCLPLAQAVIARFLGLSAAERDELPTVIGASVYGLAYLPQLEAFCRRCLQRAEPRTGAIALLLDLVAKDLLQMEEAVKLLRMLWIAGSTTTSMLLSQCVHQLLRDPSLVPQLQQDETLMHKFIEECLRLEAPESELRRITTEPTTLAGKELPAGAIVMLALRAANRDLRFYPEPDRIRLDRPARKHLSFGGGYHYCMGVGMARVEARHALELLLPLIGRLQPDLFEPAVYFPSPHFRGLSQLRVRRRQAITEPSTVDHE